MTKTKQIFNKIFSQNFISTVMLSIMTGVFAGVVITLYNICASLGEGISRNLYHEVMQNPVFIPLLFLLLAVGAIVIGTWVRFVPMIRGSGIPQIEGAARGLVRFKWYVTLCSMFAASLCCIFLGLSAGSEGPSLEMGGCTGDATSRLLKRAQMTRRLQIASGASAGLAVAFNAPITGLFFAMEEAFRSFSHSVFLCSAISVSSALVVRNLLRPLFGFSVGFTFTEFEFATIGFGSADFVAIGYIALASVIMGLLGVAFYYLMLRTKKVMKRITFFKGTGKYLIPFLLAGVFGLITHYAMGGGHDFIEALGTMGTGEYHIETIVGLGVIGTLIVVFVFKFVAGILAMACGVPCGVFIPMLAMGAGGGAVLSILFQQWGMDPIYADYFVIICMAVFFTTIVKAPITGIVMIFELTGQFTNFFPALLGVAIGFMIGEAFKTEAIYEKSLEGYLADEKVYANTKKERVEVLVQPDSYAVGKLVRRIIWPTNGLVVGAIRQDGTHFVPDGETMLEEGMLITFECDTDNLEELYNYLYDIVGKPKN